MTRSIFVFVVAAAIYLIACSSSDTPLGNFSLDREAMVGLLEVDESTEEGRLIGAMSKQLIQKMSWTVSFEAEGVLEMVVSIEGASPIATSGTWKKTFGEYLLSYDGMTHQCVLEADVLTCTFGKSTTIFKKS